MLLVTHNNSFHADDVFAAAVLKLIYKHAKIIRTREEKYFEKGDIVFDVSKKNDGIKFFDHHQTEGAGVREDGYPYAAFGLIWKKFGLQICDNNQEIVDRIDDNFVKYIDAIDNGYNPDNMNLKISISEAVALMVPNWNEKLNTDKQFKKTVKIAQKILLRKIAKEKSILLSKEIVKEAIDKAENKIVILDQNCEWMEEVIKTDNLIVVHPSTDNKKGMIRMVPVELGSFENRISLKEEWRGKNREQLEQLTGLKDFHFCHANGFIGSTDTKESAIKVAEMTINQ